MIGTTVAHYKILERLGGGGMGVVYKAEDTKLKRIVALKFLPPDLTRDEEAKTRFIHEAQAASALQHNNICTVHDIDETPDRQLFIVMDCYEGESLKEKIARGPLKTPEATDLAIQIALGLAEAHQHGIIHRDVKPANIIITQSGVAKIVDFGLAKLSGATKLTKAGSTLGTLSYMSPEQLQGADVDARADIFSLGVILYEMLTGKPPFRGEHEAALMYSITNEEPEPLLKHLPDASSELVHIVNRALEKSPADRYKTMDDVLIDLRRLRKETSKVSMPAFKGITKRGLTKKSLSLIVGSVIVLSAFVVLFVLPSLSKLPRLNPRMRERVIEVPFSEIGMPCLSRDGKLIAFSAADTKGRWDFYVMHLGSSDVRRVSFDSSRFTNQSVDFSPDGGRIVYNRVSFDLSTCALHVASVLTGESRMLVDTGYAPIWRGDGERIGYMRMGATDNLKSPSGKPEFWSIRPDGTEKKLEFADTSSIRDLTLCYSWSPDGNSIVYLSTRKGHAQEVFVRDLRTGSERQLTQMNSGIDNVRWANNGWLFFSSNKSGTTNLWIIPSEGGEPTEFTKGTNPYIDVDISTDCATLLGYQRIQVNRLWVAALEGESADAISSEDQIYSSPFFSSDDKQVVFAMGSGDPMARTTQIYLSDLNGERRKRLTFGEQIARNPIWSPDGKLIAFASFLPAGYTVWAEGSPSCYVVDAMNPASSHRVGYGIPLFWIDNQTFVCFRDSTLSGWQTFIDGREQKRFSPDSMLVVPVYSRELLLINDFRDGTQGLYVGPLDYLENASPEKLRLIHSYKPRWQQWSVAPSPTGGFALLYNGRGDFWKVRFPSCEKERLVKVFPEFQFVRGSVHVSNDGKKIVYPGRMQTKSKLVLMEKPFE